MSSNNNNNSIFYNYQQQSHNYYNNCSNTQLLHQQQQHQQYYGLQSAVQSTNNVELHPISIQAESSSSSTSTMTKNILETTLLSAKQEICQICASTVSVGLHFGAVTCEACKKFFVRYINNPEVKPVCKRKTSDCIITLKTRADCYHCRLKKCFKVGMSSENKTVKSKSFNEIPCEICTQPSSGTHFGVISCEACKTFYKRNISKRMELKCSSNGSCGVTKHGVNTSLCAYCRLTRCINVGMDEDKSKVGRQSNLVKRNLSLITNMNNQTEQPPTKRLRTSNNFNDLFNDPVSFTSSSNSTSNNENSAAPAALQQHAIDLSFSYDLYKIIDDENLLNDFPIDINAAQFDSFNVSINTNIIYQNSQLHHFQHKNSKFFSQLEHIVSFLKNHAENYVNYCEAVDSFSNLPIADRKQLTLNSVHVIRYLWLHKQNQNLNYFNENNENTLDTINEIFPVFKKADAYFKTIHETSIRNLCLDPKEFSLFSALIIFMGGYKGGKLHENTSKIKFNLSNQLTTYMHSRRNEFESYQTLISLMPHYVSLQMMVQKGISERCKQIMLEYSIGLPESFKDFYIIDGQSSLVNTRPII